MSLCQKEQRVHKVTRIDKFYKPLFPFLLLQKAYKFTSTLFVYACSALSDNRTCKLVSTETIIMLLSVFRGMKKYTLLDIRFINFKNLQSVQFQKFESIADIKLQAISLNFLETKKSL